MFTRHIKKEYDSYIYSFSLNTHLKKITSPLTQQYKEGRNLRKVERLGGKLEGGKLGGWGAELWRDNT